MKAFRRDGDHLVGDLEEAEVALLVSLVSQVDELLGGGGDPAASAGADPFLAWETEFGPGVALDRTDPVIARLFPDAYADDEAAAAEYRRYAAEDQRRARVADNRVVLAALAATGGGAELLVIKDVEVGAWLKSVNGVRLSLAVRLGIESESDHRALEELPLRDPRMQIVAIYDWLGLMLESILDAC